MDGFEQKLKSLAPREPSPGLDGRVMEALARAAAPANVIPIAAVSPRPGRGRTFFRSGVAAALLAGLMLGFLAGRFSAPRGGPAAPALKAQAPPAAHPSVTIHVVYEGRAANPFDCTTAADDGLRPVANIKFTSNAGV